MPLVEWQPAFVQVARYLRQRNLLVKVALTNVQGDIEPVDALGKDHPKVPCGQEQRSRPRAILVAAPLVAAGHLELIFETLNPPSVSLIHREPPPTVRAMLLVSGVDDGVTDGAVFCMAFHPRTRSRGSQNATPKDRDA
jgi:hypothetical protein